MTARILTRRELDAIDRALSKTISHLIATADDTPFADDPRWSPWTRFQKPLADRCREARKPVRDALRAEPAQGPGTVE
jgi:hypothetical protein